MTVLSLPALDGRTPLGFLAALGLTRLLDIYTDDSPRLAWSREDFTARLHTTRGSIDEVVADISRIVDGIPDVGVLPGVPVNFPPRSGEPSKLRLVPKQLRSLVDALQDSPEGELEAWLSSLATELCLDKGNCARLSLFVAITGRQTLRTMLDKPLMAVRSKPTVLKEALERWRRYPGVTGEQLDHRATLEGADISSKPKSGEPLGRGVPGATWLALMSFPLFRTTASDGTLTTTGWHRSRRSKSSTLALPLWSQPLDIYAVVALLEHPEIASVVRHELTDRALALGVFQVGHAARRKSVGGQSAGVLGPVP